MSKESSAVFTFHDDAKIPVTVTKGEYSTPVWIQTAWEEGEFSVYIQKNGCGHCSCAMAARLCGVPDITPYTEYENCRRLWGIPNADEGRYHWLCFGGVVESLKSYGVEAEAFGVPAGKQSEAVEDICRALSEGKLVIFCSLPLTPDNPFSSGAHYVLFVGLTEDGRVLVANSSLKARTETPGAQTVTRGEIENALYPHGCEPNGKGLTWGILEGLNDQLGYVVVTPPSVVEGTE